MEGRNAAGSVFLTRGSGRAAARFLLVSVLAGLCCVLLGYLLLSGAYLIGPEQTRQSLERSLPLFESEWGYPTDLYSGRKLDNATDATMLLESSFDNGQSPFVKAAKTSLWLVRDRDTVESLLALHGGEENIEPVQMDYERYWHGYQIFLRPLLTRLSYPQIRRLNAAVQYTLLALALLLLTRRLPGCLLPFAVTALFLAPIAIGKSLQFSSVYYLMLLAGILLLWNPRRFRAGRGVYALFLLTGAACSYLDLLTAPTVTLTIPLCVLYALDLRDGRGGRLALRRMLLCALEWLIGYAVMWGGKWLIAALLQGSGFLDSLLEIIRYRASAEGFDGKAVSRLAALRVNARLLLGDTHVSVFAAACGLLLFVRAVCNFHTLRDRWRGALGFLLPFLIAVLWILILGNHSYIHCWFTYRTLAPCVFCALTALSTLGDRKEETYG